MNKRGEVWEWLAGILLLLIIIAAIVTYAQDTGAAQYINNFPQGVQQVYDIVVAIAKPIVEGLYSFVAPAGQPENVQMIAFGMFLLLLLVGTQSLKAFFRWPIPLIISGIVGLIAARGLTSTILEQSALAASPISAVAFLIGVIPIFIVTGWMSKFYLTKRNTFIFHIVLAFVYFSVFYFAFKSLTLGIVYGIAIVLLGFNNIMSGWWKMSLDERKNMGLGAYMEQVHEDIGVAEAMRRGAAQAAARRR